MPAKNSIKQYLKNGYYHLYNRGVEKRPVFLDSQDYSVFLSYLKDYLLPKDEEDLISKLTDDNISYKEKDKINKLLKLNNFSDEISLLAYCLMPNHFHFLIRQNSPQSIDKFMNSLCTRYTMYFNKKYKRVGSLYQDVYKAVLVISDEQFLYVSKYIHKQAFSNKSKKIFGYKKNTKGCVKISYSYPSSYADYIGIRKTEWINPKIILNYFENSFNITNKSTNYKSFVEENDYFEPITRLNLEK